MVLEAQASVARHWPWTRGAEAPKAPAEKGRHHLMLVQLLPPSRAPREGVERDVRGGGAELQRRLDEGGGEDAPQHVGLGEEREVLRRGRHEARGREHVAEHAGACYAGAV